MAKSAMPVSKAKTAYGLLSEVRRIILEEPKRYDQWGWLTSGSDWAQIVYGDLAPACGTVGCVGGWVQALKHKSPSLVLGLNHTQSDELFTADAAGSRYDARARTVTPRVIRQHARRGAAHIARFQKKYAKQLKAKRV